jgi:sugar phosphate isomerase/epimerase
MSRPFISLAALTVLELPPDEMVDVAAQAGYQGVGLRLIPATPKEHHFSLLEDSGLAQRTVKRLADTGLKVTDIEVLRLKPDTNVREFSTVFEFAARLGATNALVAGNDNDASRLLDNFVAMCELAAQFDLYPHLEFMPWTDVKDLNQAHSIVRQAREHGCDNACLLVDAFHFNRSHSRVDDLEKVPAGWMRYVQLCDVAGPVPDDMDVILSEARNARCFLGDGDIDLPALIKALPEDLPVSLEIPIQALVNKGVSALERATLAIQSAHRLL